MRAVFIKMVLRILVCHLLGLPASEQSHYSSLTPFSQPTGLSCELGWGYSHRYRPHQYLLGFGLSSYWMYHPRERFVHDTGDPWSSLRPISFLFQMSLKTTKDLLEISYWVQLLLLLCPSLHVHYLTGQYIKKPGVGTTHSNFICTDEEDVRLMFQRIIFPELEFTFLWY